MASMVALSVGVPALDIDLSMSAAGGSSLKRRMSASFFLFLSLGFTVLFVC